MEVEIMKELIFRYVFSVGMKKRMNERRYGRTEDEKSLCLVPIWNP